MSSFLKFTAKLNSDSKLQGDFKRLDELRQELTLIQNRISDAEKMYDLNKAGELKYGIHTDISKDIASVQTQIKNRVLQILSDFE